MAEHETTTDDVAAWMGSPVHTGNPDVIGNSPVRHIGDLGMWSVTLQHPLKKGTLTISKITVRRLLQGDIDDLGNGVLDGNRELLCRLTGLDNDIIRALTWEDSEVLHKRFSSLLPDFLLPEDAR